MKKVSFLFFSLVLAISSCERSDQNAFLTDVSKVVSKSELISKNLNLCTLNGKGAYLFSHISPVGNTDSILVYKGFLKSLVMTLVSQIEPIKIKGDFFTTSSFASKIEIIEQKQEYVDFTISNNTKDFGGNLLKLSCKENQIQIQGVIGLDTVIFVFKEVTERNFTNSKTYIHKNKKGKVIEEIFADENIIQIYKNRAATFGEQFIIEEKK